MLEELKDAETSGRPHRPIGFPTLDGAKKHVSHRDDPERLLQIMLVDSEGGLKRSCQS